MLGIDSCAAPAISVAEKKEIDNRKSSNMYHDMLDNIQLVHRALCKFAQRVEFKQNEPRRIDPPREKLGMLAVLEIGCTPILNHRQRLHLREARDSSELRAAFRREDRRMEVAQRLRCLHLYSWRRAKRCSGILLVQ